MVLNVTNLFCSRSGRSVLAGLSFQLPAGQAMLLRGPNGVGKSTLLRALAGLVPSSGEVTLGDARLGDEDWAEQLAYAGHLDAIKPQLTVRENLAFWAGVYGGHADGALAGFDLGDLAGRLAGACSAGQKRRLGLARLALCPRKLWLLDEPSTALDSEATALLARQISAHCTAGGMALIATHTDLPLKCDSLTLTPPRHAPADPFLDEAFT